MKRLLPLPKHVLVQLDPAPQHQNGIAIPEQYREPESTGRVLELGKDCPDLHIGTRIHFDQYLSRGRTGLLLGGRKCVMLPYKDVLAIIQ